MNYTITTPWFGRTGNNIQSISNAIYFCRLKGFNFHSPPNSFIEELLEYCKPYTWKQKPLIDVLENIKNRPNFEEQWPEEYIKGAKGGKERVLKIEKIRNDKVRLENILKDQLLSWWEAL